MLLKWGEDFSELQFSRPDAAAITFAKINMPLNCEEFVFELRDNYSVLLTAGKWHGVEGYVRFGYGTSTDYVKGGLDRIAKYLIKLRKKY